jgi:hypothetical protein
LKVLFTFGVEFQLTKNSPFNIRYPNNRPIKGETIKVTKIFTNPGSIIAFQPAPITTAPTSPPTMACDELLGKPKYQVNKFHRIALDSAARITVSLMEVEATTSCPIVSATATPNMNGPKKFARAVIPRAVRGEKARLVIIVATMLLESCTPFKKSKIRANTMMIITMTVIRPPLVEFDYDIGDDVGVFVTTVGCITQVAVDLT